MTALLALQVLLAAAVATAAAGLYLAWPREMSLEEWVVRQRLAGAGPEPAPTPPRETPLFARMRWLEALVRADLRLLELRQPGTAAAEERLVAGLVRQSSLGAAAGLVAGTALWLLAGHEGPPTASLLLSLSGACLPPALSWLRLRRRAAQARVSINRRLPRVLTSARVLLESGAATPEEALRAASALYRDPAADVVRRALLERAVRRVELPDALDRAGQALGLDHLRRLSDAYRVGVRQGTRMADLLFELARELRSEDHLAYRERMTRAPVLMTVPALVFFVLPMLVLVFLLVLSPLTEAFGSL